MAREFMNVRKGIGLKPGSAPSDPANGDMYYDTSSNQLTVYQNGVWVSFSTGSGFNGRAGSQAITIATSAVSVTFSSTLSTTSYAISAVMRNTADATVQFQPVAITAKSATGFTATWNAPVDSGNYFLEYTAIPNA